MAPAAPLPIRAALTHAAGAVLMLVTVAIGWTWLPGARDAGTALAAVAFAGTVAWVGAIVFADRPCRAANDNDQPFSGSWPQFISE